MVGIENQRRNGQKFPQFRAIQFRLFSDTLNPVAATRNLFSETLVAAHLHAAFSVSRLRKKSGSEAKMAAVLWGRSSVG
jgi:hypothetical protein